MSVSIIQRAKAKVANSVKKAAGKAGDIVATAGQLSPKQVAEVDALREEYLKSLPDPSDAEAQETIARNLGAIGIETFREYLPQVSKLYLPVAEDLSAFESKRVCYFDITRWVTNKDENNIDKLITVYQVLADEDCAIALIYTRYPDKCVISLAVVNNSQAGDTADTKRLVECVKKAIKGNFPGSELDKLKIGTPKGLNFDGTPSVAVVSNLATEKSEDFVSQSMEKLLDGFAPENDGEAFSIVLLAQPIQDQEQDKCRVYELYSALSSFATWQTAKGYTESAAIMSMANAGVNAGANFNFSTGQGASQGVNLMQSVAKGASRAATAAISDAISETSTISEGASVTVGTSETVGASAGVAGSGAHAEAGSHQDFTTHVDHSHSKSKTHTESYSETQGTSYTETTGAGTSQSTSANTNQGMGANFGISFTRSSGITRQLGQSKTTTLTFTNYAVKHTLELLEEQMQRLEQCAALGMWDFAAYVISPSYSCANDVAHMYLSLTQGEKSYMEQAAINIWQGGSKNGASAAKTICESLSVLQHPTFCLNPNLTMDYLMYPSIVTATTMLSGGELAHALNFPEKSVSGLPVLECVPFGREVRSLDTIQKRGKKIELGHIYHMHKTEPNVVTLDKTSLTAHTFITGSTGAGKSNTIYRMLDELDKQDVRFMVVEPAKGEYKNVFGGRKNVAVYGTNCKKTELLQLNPFSFPEDTHVLEHIDRLVEIFNACWPMYAAMPAVLKDAVEQAYLRKGWDLTNSTCDPLLYPTFRDLMEVLPDVVKQSNYSADTQSDYIGSLYTRIKSLTNGINGQIFCSMSELAAEDLFDRNVIVDLSRVGSMETKALLMGILVLKLQEHRMAMAGDKMDSELRHVTVLEEAHNLLRRTSDIQTQESSNLQGKSVEMIANAIAEMRTYGEGFIIADQAPGLMDESVIRNTNTKIIMRLPDESDRVLVGKAASLNDDQIVELAKLPLGVAAVYQNDWLEPVLCKIEKFSSEDRLEYHHTESPRKINELAEKVCKHLLSGGKDSLELTKEDTDRLSDWIASLDTATDLKKDMLKYLKSQQPIEENRALHILYCIVKGKHLIENTDAMFDVVRRQKTIDQQIMDMLELTEQTASEIRKQIFLYAAQEVQNDIDLHRELLYYGGVR